MRADASPAAAAGLLGRRRRLSDSTPQSSSDLQIKSLPWRSRLLLAAVPLIGAALCLLLNRRGAIQDSDSHAYLSAAYNVLHGRGVTTPYNLREVLLSPTRTYGFRGAVPLVHFAPLYPVAIAVVASLGFGVDEGARWLNALLLGINLLLFEMLLRRLTSSAVLLPMAGAVLLLAGPAVQFDFLLLHREVLAEPLLIAVWLAGILCFLRYLDRPSIASLCTTGVCVAAAPLVHYSGFALLLGCVVVLLAWTSLDWTIRWQGAALLSAFGILPSAIWSLYVSHVLHGGSPREFAWHPNGGIPHDVLVVVTGWLLPSQFGRARTWLGLLVLVVVAVLLIAQYRRPRSEASWATRIFVVCAFAASYLLVVVVTRDALDALLSINDRVLSPVIPLAYAVTIATVWRVFRHGKLATYVTASLCIVIALSTAGSWVHLFRDPSPGGVPAETPTMHAVSELPPGTLIVSRVPDLVFADTGRASMGVPELYDPLTGRENPAFATELRQTAGLLIRHQGVLVFDAASESDVTTKSAYPANFKPYAQLRVVGRFPDGGTFYRLSPLNVGGTVGKR